MLRGLQTRVLSFRKSYVICRELCGVKIQTGFFVFCWDILSKPSQLRGQQQWEGVQKNFTAKCGGFLGPNLLGTFTHTSGDCRCLDSCFHVCKGAYCQTAWGDPDWRSCYLSQGYGFGRSQTRPLLFFLQKTRSRSRSRRSRFKVVKMDDFNRITSRASEPWTHHIHCFVDDFWVMCFFVFFFIGGARCVSI